MPVAVAGFVGGLGLFATAAVGITVSWAGALAVGSILIAGTVVALRKARELGEPGSSPVPSGREISVRSTEVPRNLVLGQAMVGGIITHENVFGTENRELTVEVVHTGHEVEEFISWLLDDKVVPIADVDDINAAGDGSVDADTTDHGFGPSFGINILYLRGHLGTSAQAVDSLLDSAYTEITSNHRHRGCAKTVLRMFMPIGGEEVWSGGPPGNIRAVVKGAKAYDPRLDSTFSGDWGTGSGAHRTNDSTTWEWTHNPSLLWAHVRTHSTLGPKPAWGHDEINYNAVAVAADACEVAADIPTAATEDRFSCNGTFHTHQRPAEIIGEILASMRGDERRFAGQWHVYAGIWEAPSFSLGEDDFIGDVDYRKQPDTQSGDRYNTVKGTYVDPERNYQRVDFLPVTDSSLKTNRDAGQELVKELHLEAVNGEYQAQRLAMRLVNQASLTGILVCRVGYSAANLRIGDRGEVTISELGFADKVFRLVNMKLVPFVGFELTLKEDSESAWDDPEEADYGTRSAAGVITFPNPPTRLVANGLVRDPSFSDTYGASWYTQGGFSGTIIAGEFGNALRLGISASTTAKWYVRNSATFEMGAREWFTIQARIRRDAAFGSGANARIGITGIDADGSEVAEAEIVIDDSNYATYMPSVDTWYDLVFTVQVTHTYTTSRQFGVVTVSKSNGGTTFNSPNLDFDFIQVIRGQAA